MELLCPSCQKKLTVPEQYAGQMMRCPLCQNTFTVPALPSTVAAAEPFAGSAPAMPPPQEAYGLAAEPAAAAPFPPISAESPSAASSAAPSTAVGGPAATPSAGYTRVCAMRIKPQVVQWLAPGGLVLVFLLMFLPWIDSLNAWGMGFKAWGIGIVEAKEITLRDENLRLHGRTADIVGAEKAKEVSLRFWGTGFNNLDVGPSTETTHTLVIFFDLLTVILALPLAIASLLFTLKVIPDVPALRPYLPMRSLIVGAIAGLAWFFLTLQYVILLFGEGAIPINFLGILAWWVYTIAVVGAFLEFWLEKRGPGKPVPRMSMDW